MGISSLNPHSARRTASPEHAAWVQTQWDTLAAQAAAYYQECQMEAVLQELAEREHITWERTEPTNRHFGTPEYALHLAWGQQEHAGIRRTKALEIFMGYRGTLLIEGKVVTVLLPQQWRRQPMLVRRALEEAFTAPLVESWIEARFW
jgi:hypothetical protein